MSECKNIKVNDEWVSKYKQNDEYANKICEWEQKLKRYKVNEYTNENEWVVDCIKRKVNMYKNRLSKKVNEWMSTLY